MIDGLGGEGDDDGWGVILAVSFYFPSKGSVQGGKEN